MIFASERQIPVCLGLAHTPIYPALKHAWMNEPHETLGCLLAPALHFGILHEVILRHANQKVLAVVGLDAIVVPQRRPTVHDRIAAMSEVIRPVFGPLLIYMV